MSLVFVVIGVICGRLTWNWALVFGLSLILTWLFRAWAMRCYVTRRLSLALFRLWCAAQKGLNMCWCMLLVTL